MSKLTSSFEKPSTSGTQSAPQTPEKVDIAAEQIKQPPAEFKGVKICIIGAGQRGRVRIHWHTRRSILSLTN
jgi:hypothetical protein